MDSVTASYAKVAGSCTTEKEQIFVTSISPITETFRLLDGHFRELIFKDYTYVIPNMACNVEHTLSHINLYHDYSVNLVVGTSLFIFKGTVLIDRSPVSVRDEAKLLSKPHITE